MKNKDLIQMKNKDLIQKIEKSEYLQGKYGRCVNEYLKKLKQQDPNALVMFNNGECDRDGTFIPFDRKDGREMGPPRPFREGEAIPDDDNDWVRVSD